MKKCIENNNWNDNCIESKKSKFFVKKFFIRVLFASVSFSIFFFQFFLQPFSPKLALADSFIVSLDVTGTTSTSTTPSTSTPPVVPPYSDPYQYSAPIFNYQYGTATRTVPIVPPGARPPVPPYAPSTPVKYPRGQFGLINDVNIVPYTTSADVSWKSTKPSAMTFFWGESSSYEIGCIGQLNLKNDFKVTINDLKPNTLYYYLFTLVDSDGNKFTKKGTFRTLQIKNLRTVTPPDNFYASVAEKEIVLQWENTHDPRFDHVRLVRSPYFYPKEPLEGKVIYEGRGNYAREANPNSDATYYYSIFSFDDKGNFSSPSLLKVRQKEYTQNDLKKDKDPLVQDSRAMYSNIYAVSNDSDILCSGLDKFRREGDIKNSSTTQMVPDSLTLGQGEKKIDTDEKEFKLTREKSLFAYLWLRQNVQYRDILALCITRGSKETSSAYMFLHDQETGSYSVATPPLYKPGNYKFYIGLVRRGSGQETVLWHSIGNLSSNSDNWFLAVLYGIWKFILYIFSSIYGFVVHLF